MVTRDLVVAVTPVFEYVPWNVVLILLFRHLIVVMPARLLNEFTDNSETVDYLSIPDTNLKEAV